MKEIIKYAFILGLICFLASSVLAFVNGITEPQIKAQQAREEGSSLREVMAQSSDFKPYYEGDKIIYYDAYDSKGQLNGFVLKTQVKGYSSTIEALVGLNLKLEIVDTKILSQNETPGLGSRILEPSFLGQLRGRNLDTFNQVQAITGATVSSSALLHSLQDKIAQLKDTLLQEVHNGR